MSTGKWKPKEEPPDNQPRSLLLQIAQRHQDVAANYSRGAQLHGELSELYRNAHKHEKAAPPDQEQEAAFPLTG